METVGIFFTILFLTTFLIILILFILRAYYDIQDNVKDSFAEFSEKRRKLNIVKWNPDEKMSKEHAINVIEGIGNFYDRLYYHPNIKPFSTFKEFEGAMLVLNGVKEFIESSKEIIQVSVEEEQI